MRPSKARLPAVLFRGDFAGDLDEAVTERVLLPTALAGGTRREIRARSEPERRCQRK